MVQLGTKSNSFSDLTRLESDYSDCCESEATSDSEIESDNLAGLIRFKEMDTLEKKLKDTNDENEFLKHVDARRQEYLKRDYSENDDSDDVRNNTRRRESRKKSNVKKLNNTRKSRGEEIKRSKSVPSYLRPTEASQEKAREKSPKCAELNRDVRNKNKTRGDGRLNEGSKRNKPRNKPILGLDFVLGKLIIIDLGIYIL